MGSFKTYMEVYEKRGFDPDKMSAKIAVVVVARNEEKYIKKTLIHLLRQTIKPIKIVLVNDGSTDKTRAIVSQFTEIDIVDCKPHESFVTKKQLADTINAGIEKIRNLSDVEYVMILGADHILPDNYLERVIKRMSENPQIVIASGVIDGEFSVTVRGSGRIVKAEFWKKIGFFYPVNYGFESYLLFKARSMNYDVVLFDDIITSTQRKSASSYNSKLYYNYGQALKALGYTVPYTLFKAGLLFFTKPLGAVYLLSGFFSNYDQYYETEIREFVKKQQNHKLRHLNYDDVKRFITSMHYTTNLSYKQQNS